MHLLESRYNGFISTFLFVDHTSLPIIMPLLLSYVAQLKHFSSDTIVVCLTEPYFILQSPVDASRDIIGI